MSQELVGSSLLWGFDKLRQEELLLDFTIRVGEREFKAHKQLLAASSAYFKAMFSHDTIENREMTATLEDIEPDVVEAVLEFCYTGESDLTDAVVSGLLLAASRLQIELLQKVCVKFIECNINEENCLTILMLAERINLNRLTKVSLECCCANFKSILGSQEFLTLDKLSLERIIRDDRLAVQDESLVLKAVIKWVEHEAGRERHSNDLFSLVRWVLLDPVALIRAGSSDLLRASSAGARHVENAKNFILLKDHPASSKMPKLIGDELITRPRGHMPDQSFYIVGGHTYREGKSFYATFQKYDHRWKKWTDANLHFSRDDFGCASLDGSIYVIGGCNYPNNFASCLRLDLDSPTEWRSDVVSLEKPRYSLRAVAYRGCIYAIGGKTSDGESCTVERYDPKTQFWHPCRSLEKSRCYFAAAVYRGHIYVAGGGQYSSRSVQRMTEKGIWEDFPDMKIARKNFSLCFCQGRLYAVGGSASNDSATDVSEYFDEQNQIWRLTSNMVHKHRTTQAIEVGGLIYAVEASTAEKQESLVESYNPRTGQWTQQPSTPINVAASFVLTRNGF